MKSLTIDQMEIVAGGMSKATMCSAVTGFLGGVGIGMALTGIGAGFGVALAVFAWSGGVYCDN